ncbi:MAG: hypothetical protein N2117_05645 [Anaerolineales bacterium]|nr:hypothetical protein [Anaerolineales bacterium]MCX7754715.1 hypothetical protein [Anaerolineales bacterium]MDW8278137.1 hypothetical protein [Anaerolineales bacterium]
MAHLLAFLSDFLVGLPAGLLIFMSAMASGAFLRQRGIAANGLELVILAVSAAIVGLLIRISRKQRAFPTALAGGLVSAAVITYLQAASPHNATLNPLLFGVPGIVICLLIPPLVSRR